MKARKWMLFCVLFCAEMGIARSQEDSLLQVISAKVEWSSQFPQPVKKQGRKIKSARDLLGAIAGSDRSDEMALNKPVALYATDPQHYWVADQGAGLVFGISNNKIGAPRVFAKGKFRAESIVGICNLPGKGIVFSDSRVNKLYLLLEDGRKVVPFAGTDTLMQPTGICNSPVTGEIWVT